MDFAIFYWQVYFFLFIFVTICFRQAMLIFRDAPSRNVHETYESAGFLWAHPLLLLLSNPPGRLPRIKPWLPKVLGSSAACQFGCCRTWEPRRSRKWDWKFKWILLKMSFLWKILYIWLFIPIQNYFFPEMQIFPQEGNSGSNTALLKTVHSEASRSPWNV